MNKLLLTCFISGISITSFAQPLQESNIAFAYDTLKLSIYSDTFIYKKGNELNAEVGYISSGYKTIVIIENGYIKKKTKFYPDGKKFNEYNFSLRKLNGAYYRWNVNQKLREKGFYKNDLEDSTWTYYYDNGLKETEGNYLADSSALTKDFEIWSHSWIPSQHILGSKTNHSPPHGTWVFYDEKGNTAKQLVFDKGTLILLNVGEHFEE